MEAKRIDKFKRSNLYNLSNVTYKYLKNKLNETGNDRLRIREDFDFESYKESIRMGLNEFSYTFNSLVALNQHSTTVIAASKSRLKDHVDEILDNDQLLENYAIYKLQQFINRVATKTLESDYKNFETISKKDKYLIYRDIKIDVSNIIGFIDDNKIIDYLYSEFNLKRVRPNEYIDSLKIKESEDSNENAENFKDIDKHLFKVGASKDDNGHFSKHHPFSDNQRIMECLREDYVAELKPIRVLKRTIQENDESEDIL